MISLARPPGGQGYFWPIYFKFNQKSPNLAILATIVEPDVNWKEKLKDPSFGDLQHLQNWSFPSYLDIGCDFSSKSPTLAILSFRNWELRAQFRVFSKMWNRM